MPNDNIKSKDLDAFVQSYVDMKTQPTMNAFVRLAEAAKRFNDSIVETSKVLPKLGEALQKTDADDAVQDVAKVLGVWDVDSEEVEYERQRIKREQREREKQRQIAEEAELERARKGAGPFSGGVVAGKDGRPVFNGGYTTCVKCSGLKFVQDCVWSDWRDPQSTLTPRERERMGRAYIQDFQPGTCKSCLRLDVPENATTITMTLDGKTLETMKTTLRPIMMVPTEKVMRVPITPRTERVRRRKTTTQEKQDESHHVLAKRPRAITLDDE